MWSQFNSLGLSFNILNYSLHWFLCTYNFLQFELNMLFCIIIYFGVHLVYKCIKITSWFNCYHYKHKFCLIFLCLVFNNTIEIYNDKAYNHYCTLSTINREKRKSFHGTLKMNELLIVWTDRSDFSYIIRHSTFKRTAPVAATEAIVTLPISTEIWQWKWGFG